MSLVTKRFLYWRLASVMYWLSVTGAVSQYVNFENKAFEFQEMDSLGWLNYSVQNSSKCNHKNIIYLDVSISNRDLHHKLVLSPSET